MHCVKCSIPACVIEGRHIGSGAAWWLPWEFSNIPRQILEMAIKRNFTLFLILGTSWWTSRIPFLGQYILSLSAISMQCLTPSYFCIFSFTFFRWFSSVIRFIGFIILNLWKKPWFFLKCYNTSAGEVSSNKVSHLSRFILGFGTENSVPLSEVSHLLSVPLSKISLL